MKITVINRDHEFYLHGGKVLEEREDGKFKVELVWYHRDTPFSEPIKKYEQKVLKSSEFIFNKDHEDKIPKGSYCYSGSRNPSDKNYKPCPYWTTDPSQPDQSCGKCTLTKSNDWEDDGHLWDQLKVCGINTDRD